MTNTVKTPRYLEPSEIELWELSKKATPGLWWSGEAAANWDMRGESLAAVLPDNENEVGVLIAAATQENADYIAAANPLTISSLLETLEKTRALLVPFSRLDNTTVGDSDCGIGACAGCRHRANDDEVVSHAPDCPIIRAQALLAGFSGDASKEEK